MSERMRPNVRQSWQRKEKKREKKLSNCLAGLAICPHKKLGNNSHSEKVTREKKATLAGHLAPLGGDLLGWVGINTGRFVSLVAVIRVTIN